MSTKIDVDKLDFAFQPIVNTYTGKIFAVEALIRNVEELEFESIFHFFDTLAEKKILYKVDMLLRKKAIKKYRKININNLKLFYNIDNRFFTMPDFKFGETAELLEKYELSKDSICFEITEHSSFDKDQEIKHIISTYKSKNYNIAIDDFGTGISGLHLLYISDTNFIKIDKFFIENIHKDAKKRLFCASIVEMAHTMGIKVIAEGIETKEEYYVCKEIKADYIQGYLVSRPTLDIKEIKKFYTKENIFEKDRRVSRGNFIDKSFIDKIDPLNVNASLHELFVYFKEHTLNTFVPIIDDEKKILGAIYEVDIKEISYSQYGLSLAKNDSFKAKLKSYIKPVLEIDISWGIDKALEIFNMQNDAKGIFVTKDSQYYGFINLNNLLSLSYKRNIEIAQNQNPLTKLPGNNQIESFISNSFKNNKHAQIVYFDFNDFKPFNDTYGFRQGDRAILMFSEILQKNISSENFIAHVGGDDFFVGFTNSQYEDVYYLIKNIQEEFQSSASSLYNEKDIANAYMTSKDRFGVSRNFKLLSVSAAIIEISENSSLQQFNLCLGNIKSASKKSSIPLGTSIF
ncbi:GGDEF domain-containing protein [Halarcobacter bivalviorum]|uniref:Diguanylate cyclase/phosphodiesterase n=1 Tax=Halarcobacter bivalviorum TaxID=663364 RepID=A0AAX2A7N0_9BACT|nr:GGDEF domain-containing protein [Halarcobacter bivalviorum]AXH11222.1 diguanylate cyclase/phosphodiesterase [Halarcobacter bivalviorum]RXK09494.1 GGDEF domain-containing protein [Halarcobacter bivalviorum]